MATPRQRAVMIQCSGRRTVQQVFIGEQSIGGGYDELATLDRASRLDTLLADD